MIARAAAARLALFLLSVAPVPALADTTARYAIGEGKQVLVVEIDDGGDARVGLDGVFSVIRRGGVDYISVEVPGENIVGRLDDAIKIGQAQLATKAIVDDGKEPLFVIGGGSDVQVAGYLATSWTFGPQGSESGKALSIALTTDPELAPVGALVRRLVDSALLVFEGAVIPASSQFGPRLRELLAKGTPVRIAPVLELTSVDHKEIDPHRFELPGPVASVDALTKAMSAGRPAASPGTPLQPLP